MCDSKQPEVVATTFASETLQVLPTAASDGFDNVSVASWEGCRGPALNQIVEALQVPPTAASDGFDNVSVASCEGGREHVLDPILDRDTRDGDGTESSLW